MVLEVQKAGNFSRQPPKIGNGRLERGEIGPLDPGRRYPRNLLCPDREVEWILSRKTDMAKKKSAPAPTARIFSECFRRPILISASIIAFRHLTILIH
jgi:hypothetical protein